MTVPSAGFRPALSVYEEARKEAERHKWLASEHAGHDVGRSAIDHWYRAYWPVFCLQKRLEHLTGCQPWREFQDEPFGKLCPLLNNADSVVLRIVEWAHAGGENLTMINRALDKAMPIDRVLHVLTELDVNRARLDPLLN